MDIRVELYQFKHGDKAWYFTNHRKDVVHNGITYKKVRGLDRDAIEDADIDKCEIEVIFPQPYPLKNDDDDDFTSIFLNRIYFESVYLTVLELEQNETLVLFMGRVTQPKFDDSADTMTLVCSTGESYLNRTILTRKFQKTCPNSIYDRWCGLKFEEWAFDVTVTAISGLTITFTVNPTQVKDAEGNLVFEQVPVLDELGQPVLDGNGQPTYINGDPVMETKTYAAGYLNRGLFKKLGVSTFVVGNTANTVTLYREHVGVKVGDVIQLAPGCDQSLKTCHEKFKNAARFAGHPYMPSENPVMNQLIK
ncbi:MULTISPECIES: phage BR0599 family protein [unclassified Acinetobacter]|uniref:phage BR0599 family protein n=1 Tax=unclassified Acinetobacter TaxID=196816 RepID=UPI0015D3FF2B|nr:MULTISPECIES: phage BR0599 family protein [unclassified Acinetobacter]